MQKVDKIKDRLKNKVSTLKENLLKVIIHNYLDSDECIQWFCFGIQQPIQIPQMGFSDHSIHNVSLVPESYMSSRMKDEKDSADAEASNESARLSDQEVLEEVEAIYFSENVNVDVYTLKVS